MKTKNLLLIFGLLLCSVSAVFAQEKIVERSASRAPKWLGIAQSDYVIASAQAETLDEAQDKCMNDIRQSIINGVSFNICSEETSTDRQTSHNNSTDVFRGYTSEVKTVAAKLPFIANISSSDAEIYWERRLIKKEKKYYYIVHMRYPFSQAQRDELIAQFLKQDREQYDKYLTLKDRFDKFTSIEEIGRALNDLRPLANYFFDSRRHDEVVALRRNYERLYSAISIVPYSNELGCNFFYFQLDGRMMQTSVEPIIKKQYATNIVVQPVEGGYYMVTYDYDQCLDDDENTIELLYRIGGGHTLKHHFAFDVSQGKTVVIPFGQIEIVPQKEGDDELPLINGSMNLRSKYEEEFTVEELRFSISGFSQPVECAPQTKISGKGDHRLNFTATIENTKWTPGKSTMAYGSVVVRNKRSGKTSEVKFSLPCLVR